MQICKKRNFTLPTKMSESVSSLKLFFNILSGATATSADAEMDASPSLRRGLGRSNLKQYIVDLPIDSIACNFLLIQYLFLSR